MADEISLLKIAEDHAAKMRAERDIADDRYRAALLDLRIAREQARKAFLESFEAKSQEAINGGIAEG